MKKLTSTLALASVLFFASCQKDDVQNSNTATPAVKSQLELLQDGSWDFESYKMIATMDGDTVYEETDDTPGKVTFLKNNTVIFVDGNETDTSSYAYSTDKLVIDDSDFKINTLIASDLVLVGEETEIDDDLQAEVKYTTTLTFKK